MASASCFGVVAEASAFKVQAFGVKVEGSSISVLSIVVLIGAALFLLKAKKETTPGPSVRRRKPRLSDHLVFHYAAGPGEFRQPRLPELEVYELDPSRASRLRRFVNVSLVGGIIIVILGLMATIRVW